LPEKEGGLLMTPDNEVVFLFDVDNTLLDNDRVTADLRRYLEKMFGPESATDTSLSSRNCAPNSVTPITWGRCSATGSKPECDPRLLDDIELPGGLPVRQPLIPRFARRVGACGAVGPAVILSDGDVVFPAAQVRRSSLWDAVEGRVLIYIHKELMLDDVEGHYPARRYVMVDDKLRILAAMKNVWGDRLTTVFAASGALRARPRDRRRLPCG